jgi:hypothetical protein
VAIQCLFVVADCLDSGYVHLQVFPRWYHTLVTNVSLRSTDWRSASTRDRQLNCCRRFYHSAKKPLNKGSYYCTSSLQAYKLVLKQYEVIAVEKMSYQQDYEKKHYFP